MGKDPAVLFYTSDFLTGTILMTDEQVGKYIRLLCVQHQKGRLSEKDMLHICKSYDADIWAKFQNDGDGFYNLRMEEEAIKRKNYSESRKNNRKGHQVTENEQEQQSYDATYDNTYVRHMENENENENINVNRVKKGGVGGKQNLVDELIEMFAGLYQKQREMPYLKSEKDKKAVGMMLSRYRKSNPEADTDKCKSDMTVFFNQCLNISNKWLYENMTLSIINSKINEIRTILRGQNGRTDDLRELQQALDSF